MDRENTLLKQRFEAEVKAIAHLHGESRFSAIQAAIDRESQAGDIDAKIFWLKELIRAGSDEKRLDHKLRGLSELRSIYDANPNYANLKSSILWYYKWLAEEMPEHADVPRATIEQVFMDMEAFYTQEREALRPVYGIRCHAAMRMGRREEAEEWYRKWQEAPRGKSDDCPACELGLKIEYLLFCEQDKEALEAVEPLLKGEVRVCNSTPATLTWIAGAAMKNQRRGLAKVLLHGFRRSVRRMRSNLTPMAAHVIYRLLLGDLQRSRRLAIVALQRAKESLNDRDLFSVYRAAGLWAASVLILTRQDKPFPRRLMPNAKPADEKSIPLSEMAAVCWEAARQIAMRFDQRNETNRYCDGLNELDAAIRKMVELKEDVRIGS